MISSKSLKSVKQRSYSFGKKSETRLKYLDKIGFAYEAKKLQKNDSNSFRFKQIKHKQKSHSVKESLKKTKNILNTSGHFLDPTRIISVTASKWAIFDYFTGKYIRGYRANDTNQLTVFSKLLVFATVNTLVNKHQLDISRFQVIVTETPLKAFGKSKRCLLKKDDIVSLEHMLYLLLLEPSQQYELIIGINIGAYLLKKRKKEYYSVFDAEDKFFKVHIQEFYDFVNSYCQIMDLQNVKYLEFEPELKRQKNKCNAYEITMLSIQCLRMPLFQKILKTKKISINIKYVDDFGTVQYTEKILNNQSIDNPYISYYNVCRNWGDKFMNSVCSIYYQEEGISPIVAVIIGSHTPKDREKDIQQIIEWYLYFEKKKKTKKLKMEELKASEEFLISELKEGIRNNRKKDEAKEEQQEDEMELPDIAQKKYGKTVFNSFNKIQGIKKPHQLKPIDYPNKFGINKMGTTRKFKTQLSPELETILQQKLRLPTYK